MSTLPTKPIPHYFSIYLDLLRFSSAMIVVIYHMKTNDIGPESILKFIPARGHDFVILFFVLSGYVISATVDRKKDQTLKEYVLDRMARVYSVAIPALLLSLLLAFIFGQPMIELGKVICNFFFLGQVGFEGIYPFFNVPYWSLCYEVMYYIGFGCYIFLTRYTRVFCLLLFILVAGPKVLLLMPCWLLGVLIYHYRDKITLKFSYALVVAILVPFFIALFCHLIRFDNITVIFTRQILGEYYERFGFSNVFLEDYIRAIIIAINLYAMRFVVINWPKPLELFITKAASMSFTLYLMHMPILLIIMNNIPREQRGLTVFIITAISILVLCYFISLITEARRLQLRGIFDVWLSFFKFGRQYQIRTGDLLDVDQAL